MSNWVKKGKMIHGEYGWAQLPIVDTSYPDVNMVYYSTRDNQNRSKPRRVCFKKDWTMISDSPIDIPLGKPGSFDSHGVMPTEIVTLEDGTKYLYYIGWSKRIDIPYWNSLGLAVSKDNGITWEKYSENPIFLGDDGNFTGTVCIYPYSNGIWLMYYSSARWEIIEGIPECVYNLKIAQSYDQGITWRYTGIAIHLLTNEGGIACPKILKDGDYAYQMYFSVRNKIDYRTNPKHSYKIKKAYSSDLINWHRENNQSEFLQPEGDELMCAYPYIVEEKDKYIMFYNTDFGSKGISYAVKFK